MSHQNWVHRTSMSHHSTFSRPPAMGPIPHEQQQFINKPKFVLDGITREYVDHWTPSMAVDEHVQNWRDQMEIQAGGEKITIVERENGDIHTTLFTVGNRLLAALEINKSCSQVSYKGGYSRSSPTVRVRLRNYCSRMFPSYFQFGSSGKRTMTNVRGKFGDGLPSSTLVLTRNTFGGIQHVQRKVVVASCGRLYTFGFEQGEMSREANCFTIYNNDNTDDSSAEIHGAIRFDPSQDTEVKLMLLGDDFDSARYLFLRDLPDKSILSDASGQVLLEREYRGAVYLRGMRAQKSEDRKSQFGYNFTDITSQSRDRQNTIPQEDLEEYVVNIWLGLVCDPHAASRLYDSLLQETESIESRALKDTSENTSVASCWLADVFIMRNPGAVFPVVEGDHRGKVLVEKHLGKQAVVLSRTLFQLLCGSKKVETSVEVAWDKMIKEFVKTATVISKNELEKKLCRDVASVVQKVLKKSLKMRVVSERIPGGAISVVDGPKNSTFELSGFCNEFLNGTYKEMPDMIHCREAFRGGLGNQYCLVWESNFSRWKIVNFTALPTWARRGTTGAYAMYSLENFWEPCIGKWSSWTEVFNNEFGPAWDVTVTSRDQQHGVSYRVLVSRGAVRDSCHDLQTLSSRKKCETHETFWNTCFCAYDELAEQIIDSLKEQYRVNVPKRDRERLTAELHRIYCDSCAEWKRLCSGSIGIGSREVTVEASEDSSVVQWLRNLRDGTLSMEDDVEDRTAQEMKKWYSQGLWRPGAPIQAEAYLGDAFLSFYIAWEGTIRQLTASRMDTLRRTILSDKSMNGKERYFLGEMGKKVKTWPRQNWLDLAQRVSSMTIPFSSESLFERVWSRMPKSAHPAPPCPKQKRRRNRHKKG